MRNKTAHTYTHLHLHTSSELHYCLHGLVQPGHVPCRCIMIWAYEPVNHVGTQCSDPVNHIDFETINILSYNFKLIKMISWQF